MTPLIAGNPLRKSGTRSMKWLASSSGQHPAHLSVSWECNTRYWSPQSSIVKQQQLVVILSASCQETMLIIRCINEDGVDID